jgi:two-component system response regulator PilR (NtrC family)
VIAKHLLHKLAHSSGMAAPLFTDRALLALSQYAFPGNVRELENILERTLALHEGEQIDVGDLNLPASVNRQLDEDEDTESASLQDYLESVEKKVLLTALEQNRWNPIEAAEQLGISQRSLLFRLKRLGLEV